MRRDVHIFYTGEDEKLFAVVTHLCWHLCPVYIFKEFADDGTTP